MDLAAHQRKLLGLVRATYQVRADDDPYIHRVAQSKDLEEARRNVFLWRIYVLERTCALTFTLLKRRNLLKETVSAFIEDNALSRGAAMAFYAVTSLGPSCSSSSRSPGWRSARTPPAMQSFRSSAG